MIWLHSAAALSELEVQHSYLPKEELERRIRLELTTRIGEEIAKHALPIIPVHKNEAYYYEMRFPFFEDAEARECIRDKQELKAYRELAGTMTHMAVARQLHELDMEILLGK